MKKSFFAGRLAVRGLALLLAVLTVAGAVPVTAWAEMVDTGNNTVVTTPNVPRGKTGRRMNVTFTLVNDSGETWEDVEVGFSEDVSYIARPDALAGEYIFPFEVTSGLFDTKHVGTIRSGGKKSVSLSAKVRADLAEGYYYVNISVSSKDSKVVATEAVNMWISKSTGTSDEDEEEDRDVGFVLGENQSTPYGVYPNVVDFTINMRNSGYSEAKDVNVAMVLDKDSAVFPFDINEGNYDRNFEKIAPNEVVQLPYSMAIRSDTYTGYYPIKFEINYRETATGELLKDEETFWVRIKNKEKDDASGEFNENDRTKARIVVDSFETVPATIIAGDPFKLILRMKNASSSIAASNILFSLESEKVDNSAVFTTASGSSSVVVNSLAAGEVTELEIDLVSRAGIDQRSYGLTIKETYDSPEFKNASESVTIDIPIRQIARLNTGTMEVMPDSISTGSESNIMFPINNTGKVILYNVMVKFEADSIEPAEAYVGNIKPGETGNVDIMLTGSAPTQDEGKIKVLITYEDENGEVQEAEEKELTLFVTEDMGDDFGMDINVEDLTDIPAESPSVFAKYKIPVIIGILAAVSVGVIVAIRIKKKRKARQEEEEIDNEIS